MQFADRLNNVETSAIRELFKLLGKPGIISFAGGFPDSAMFDVAGISAASQAALQQEPGAALQYGATEGYQPLREQIAAFMAAKGARDLAPDQLVVTTGSQQALDLLGKTPATRSSWKARPSWPPSSASASTAPKSSARPSTPRAPGSMRWKSSSPSTSPSWST
jgi:DNA-binding transcriptional MocR family regulator